MAGNATGEKATPVISITPEEHKRLLADAAELRHLKETGVGDDSGALCSRPKFYDEETKTWRQMDLETEAQMSAKRQGKRVFRETVDPDTGRVTKTEVIEADQRFQQRIVGDRARAEAMVAALGTGAGL